MCFATHLSLEACLVGVWMEQSHLRIAADSWVETLRTRNAEKHFKSGFISSVTVMELLETLRSRSERTSYYVKGPIEGGDTDEARSR